MVKIDVHLQKLLQNKSRGTAFLTTQYNKLILYIDNGGRCCYLKWHVIAQTPLTLRVCRCHWLIDQRISANGQHVIKTWRRPAEQTTTLMQNV